MKLVEALEVRAQKRKTQKFKRANTEIRKCKSAIIEKEEVSGRVQPQY